jgi:hypothetical protein
MPVISNQKTENNPMLTLLILSVLWSKRKALREKVLVKIPKLGAPRLKKSPAL